MVTRLSVANASALHTQTPTTPAHTVAVIILEASLDVSQARLHRLLASTLPQLARFRSRLVGKPLGMGRRSGPRSTTTTRRHTSSARRCPRRGAAASSLL